jgi:hypothetical protein
MIRGRLCRSTRRCCPHRVAHSRAHGTGGRQIAADDTPQGTVGACAYNAENCPVVMTLLNRVSPGPRSLLRVVRSARALTRTLGAPRPRGGKREYVRHGSNFICPSLRLTALAVAACLNSVSAQTLPLGADTGSAMPRWSLRAAGSAGMGHRGEFTARRRFRTTRTTGYPMPAGH